MLIFLSLDVLPKWTCRGEQKCDRCGRCSHISQRGFQAVFCNMFPSNGGDLSPVDFSIQMSITEST